MDWPVVILALVMFLVCAANLCYMLWKSAHQVPDAVLSFIEDDEKISADFLILLPTDEVRKKKYILVEIRNDIRPESSQEEQVL